MQIIVKNKSTITEYASDLRWEMHHYFYINNTIIYKNIIIQLCILIC